MNSGEENGAEARCRLSGLDLQGKKVYNKDGLSTLDCGHPDGVYFSFGHRHKSVIREICRCQSAHTVRVLNEHPTNNDHWPIS